LLSDEDFLPSEFSDWPKNPASENHKELLMPVSTEKRAAEGNTSASDLKNKTPFPCQKQNSHQDSRWAGQIGDQG